jgi:hypothetical protein
MNDLTNEQIKSILDDAPKNATEIYRDEYISSDTDREGYLQHGVYVKQRHSLSDLAETLALRERVAELEHVLFDVREVLDSCDQSCLGDASNSEGMVWAVRDEVIHNISVSLNKSTTKEEH